MLELNKLVPLVVVRMAMRILRVLSSFESELKRQLRWPNLLNVLQYRSIKEVGFMRDVGP